MPLLPRARPDLNPELLPQPLDRRGSGRRYTVALQGFSEYERDSLAAFFRLVFDRSPTYELSDSLEGSDFAIADSTLASTGLRAGSTIYIGTQAPGDALALLPRPIDPVEVVRTLDARVAEFERGLADVFDAEAPPAAPGLQDAGPAARRTFDLDRDPFFVEELADIPVPPALSQLALPLVHAPSNWDETRPKDVLVIDESLVALRFLEMRLRRLGYRVFRARTSTGVLEWLAGHSFAFVFLDVAFGEPARLDGLQLCRRIKERNRHPGQAAPVVVAMVDMRITPEDRLKAEFAGFDACLGEPLDERDLINTLGRHDPTFGRTLDPGMPVTARRA